MPEEEPRRSMVGAPPISKRAQVQEDDKDNARKSMVGTPPTGKRARGNMTPRTSSRIVKKVKKEEDDMDDEMREDDNLSDRVESDDQDDDSVDEDATPSRKTSRKRKRAPLTDYHLKKKKILARKAQRDAEREKEKEKSGEEEEKEREPTPEPVRKPPCLSSYTPLQLMMDHILRKIMEKDSEQYFTFPVTPSMAPDYHEIIKNPMDFTTMREKIDDKKYSSIPEMREDCELIVKNAMQYNQANTVFYFAAFRLSSLIKYYFGEQYLRYIFHTLPFANEIPLEKAGLTPYSTVLKEKVLNRRGTEFIDDMTSDQCMEEADSKVRDKLTARKPKAKMVFLNEKNGTMVLNVLSEGPSAERTVTLGEIVGPLEEGTPGMIQLGEHRLYSQTPVSYLNYGAYSSFAPHIDSTWASMTKEDTDLFIRTYGDRTSSAEAISMRKFLADSGEDTIKLVDDLLDSLTDGEHSKTMKEIDERERIRATEMSKMEAMVKTEGFKDLPISSLVDDVSTLSNLGIETSFLNAVFKPFQSEQNGQSSEVEFVPGAIEHMDVQQRLDHIGQGIQDLAHIQMARLTQQPPAALSAVADPGPLEQKLAVTVQQQLVEQVSQYSTPANFVSAPSLHDAMGVDAEDDLFSEFFVTQ